MAVKKIQNRLDRLYDDRLVDFIEPDFFERKSREGDRHGSDLLIKSPEYQEAAHDHVQDGIRLLELPITLVERRARFLLWFHGLSLAYIRAIPCSE